MTYTKNFCITCTQEWMQPEQAKPCAASWVNLRRALRLWSNWHGHLHQPLGRWLIPGPLLGCNWTSDLTKRIKQLILAKQGVYKIYHRKRHSKYPITPHGTVPSLPSDAYPVSIAFQPQSIKVKRSPFLFLVFAASLPRAFTDYLATLDQWEHLHFNHLELTVSPYKIIAALASHEAIYSARDRYVKDYQGSFGWLLSSPDGIVILKCSGPAYGKQMKWYRAKWSGVLSLLCFMYRLYSFCQEPLPEALSLFCNSKSLLYKTCTYLQHSRFYPNTSLQPDWDVVQQIALSSPTHPILSTLKHIKMTPLASMT
jgi:hypothetical protein